MEPLLEINHINYAYHSMQGETPALQNIHFTVCKGDFIAVVGPSGCGKTTLLSLIAGLLLPEEGEILLNMTVSMILKTNVPVNFPAVCAKEPLLSGLLF